MGWIILAAWAIQSTLAFWVLLKVQRQFNKKLRHSYLTNGDIMFNAFVAFFPVSLLAALSLAVIAGWGDKSEDWANRRSPLDR